MKFIRSFLDILFTTLIFTIIFFLSYETLVLFKIIPTLSWSLFFIIGFLQTVLFRFFGYIIGAKNAIKDISKDQEI